MDEINSKINATRRDNLLEGQAVLMYGYNATNDRIKYVSVTDDNKLETTASISASGLATEAKQDDMITILNSVDGKITECNTGDVTVTSTVLAPGAANDQLQNDMINVLTDINDGLTIKGNTSADGSGTDYNVVVNADGHLQVDVLSGGGGGVQYNDGDALGATPTGTVILGNDNGNASVLKVSDLGYGLEVFDLEANNALSETVIRLTNISNSNSIIETNTGFNYQVGSALDNTTTAKAIVGNDVSGNAAVLNINGQGELTVKDADANTILTSINDGLTIKGNTSADGSGTDYNVVVNADGRLQVDVLSGGGGGVQYNDGDALGATPTGTVILGNDNGNASVLKVSDLGYGLEVFDLEANNALSETVIRLTNISNSNSIIETNTGFNYQVGSALDNTTTAKAIVGNDVSGNAAVLNINGQGELTVKDADANTILTSINDVLVDVNDKITIGNDQTLSEAQQVLIYGEVVNGSGSGELHPIHISQQGDVKVEISGLDFKGQQTMTDSFPVVIANDQSAVEIKKGAATTVTYTSANNSNPKQTTSIDLDGTNGCVSFFGNNPNTGDQIGVQFSADNNTWYTSGDFFIQSDLNTNDYAVNLENLGVRYVRLFQTNDTAIDPWIWTNISSAR